MMSSGTCPNRAQLLRRSLEIALRGIAVRPLACAVVALAALASTNSAVAQVAPNLAGTYTFVGDCSGPYCGPNGLRIVGDFVPGIGLAGTGQATVTGMLVIPDFTLTNNIYLFPDQSGASSFFADAFVQTGAYHYVDSSSPIVDPTTGDACQTWGFSSSTDGRWSLTPAASDNDQLDPPCFRMNVRWSGNNGRWTRATAVVPEGSAVAMTLLGLVGILLMQRRSSARRSARRLSRPQA